MYFLHNLMNYLYHTIRTQDLYLPFRGFKEVSENIHVLGGRKYWLTAFSPIPKMFSAISETNFNFLSSHLFCQLQVL